MKYVMAPSLRSHFIPHQVLAGGHLALATLGSASLSIAGSSPVLGPGKLLALLIYLACAPHRRARTDELVDLFWPRQDTESGHHDLRQALWRLRRQLGSGAVVSTPGAVALQATIQVDRDEFLGALERGALEHALSIYRGEFLACLPVSQAVGFEHWVDSERYRLRRLFVRAGEGIIRGWLASGDVIKAQRLALRIRDADPEDEIGWALLLETLLAAGDLARAGAEADFLEWRLAAEGRTRGQASRALPERVRADGSRRTQLAPVER